MLRDRVIGYRDAIRARLRATFMQDHPPHLIGVSFAIGVFVTTLPTLGIGVAVLAGLAYWYSWANRLALFAAVMILNPIVKGGVHAMSIALGTFLLGPVPEIVDPELSVTTGRELLTRLLVGNLIFAVIFAVVGYVIAFYGAVTVSRYRT